jgi:hypothetical protein
MNHKQRKCVRLYLAHQMRYVQQSVLVNTRINVRDNFLTN